MNPTHRKKLVFKQGKPKLILSREVYTKANAGMDKQRFSLKHYGDCIVSVKLKESNSSTRGQHNYVQIIKTVMSKGEKYRPDRVVKTGFRSANLYYNSPIKANELLSDTKISERLECDILNHNMSV